MRRSHYFGGEDKPRIEIVPMIDVMMFLLVFFVLIMTEMIQGAGIQLELPKSSTAKELESVKVNVGVDRIGHFYLDGAVVDRQALQGRLQSLTEQKKVDVVVSGDSATSYQYIVEAMDVVRTTGITSIGLATRTP